MSFLVLCGGLLLVVAPPCCVVGSMVAAPPCCVVGSYGGGSPLLCGGPPMVEAPLCSVVGPFLFLIIIMRHIISGKLACEKTLHDQAPH
jgi:hypothetical protein